MIDPVLLHQTSGPPPVEQFPPPRRPLGPGFASVLQETLEKPKAVTFSAHARQRLESRNIQFSEIDHARIEKAMDDASAKGARESLLIMDRASLVVSVPNRTVITVVEPNPMANAVFTQIDSVVVMADR